MKNLPDYQPLPPVGEPENGFDTKCSRCNQFYVEEEVDSETGLCVNCVAESTKPNAFQGQANPQESEQRGTLRFLNPQTLEGLNDAQIAIIRSLESEINLLRTQNGLLLEACKKVVEHLCERDSDYAAWITLAKRLYGKCDMQSERPKSS